MTEQEIRTLIGHMLARPEMYAQNPGSLEDQFCLVLSFLDVGLAYEYRHHCYSLTGTVYAVAPTKTMDEMVEFLRTFWNEWGDV
jgi:hypothetical protein